MKKILQLISLIILSLLMNSSSCDKGGEGCTDSNACNYTDTAAIDDGSCYYPEVSFDCSGNCLEEWDCSGSCGGTATVDACLICCGGNTQLECIPDPNNCPECPGDQVLGCSGCYDTLIVLDCDSICGGLATLDDCNQCYSGTTGLKENQDVGCDGECFSGNLWDACQNCVGDEMEIGQSWRMEIVAEASMSLFGDTLESDTDTVVLGASVYAFNGWNLYNGVCSDGSFDICYSDVPYPSIGSPDPNYIRFYFPHPEWKGDIPDHFNTSDIKQDITGNDFEVLFSDGMSWYTEIDPYPPEAIINNLTLKFNYLEGIDFCQIKVILGREKSELEGGTEHDVPISSNQLELAVESGKKIKLTINVSDICFQYSQ